MSSCLPYTYPSHAPSTRSFITQSNLYNYYIDYVTMMNCQSRMRSTGLTAGDVRRQSNAHREDRPIYQPPHKVQDSEGYKTPRKKNRVISSKRKPLLHSNIKPSVRDRIGLKRSCEPEPEQYVPERIVLKPPKVRCGPIEDRQLEHSDARVLKSEDRGSDSDPNDEKSDIILNYCLDKKTQRIIARLQSDFRMTEKYVSFTMYEKPEIAELKPFPVTTANTLHNRFKCLFTDFSNRKDINAQNFDLAMELEDGTEKEVLETLTAEVANEFCNP